MASVGETTFSSPGPKLGASLATALGESAAEIELRRLAALRRLSVLDTPPEPAFDDVAKLAARICETPMALVSLVDEHRQWFKAKVGLDAQETGRDVAFCAHAIAQPHEPLVVSDATQDTRFRDNPFVVNDPGIRFYAGAPIVTREGLAVGTVCAFDSRPRSLSSLQLQALGDLARHTAQLLEQRSVSYAPPIERVAAAVLELDAVVTVAPDGVIASANDRFRAWCGPHELCGRTLDEVLPAQAGYVFSQYVEEATHGTLVEHEVLLDLPFGGRYVRASYAPIVSGPRIVGVALRLVDLHALHELACARQQRLEQVSERSAAQQRFVRMIAHDVREPINTICNFSQLLQRRCGDELGETATKYLGFVHEGGQRIRTMVEDLLTLVRLDGAPLRKIEVGLFELVRAAACDLTAAVERTGAEVTIDELPTVWADATLVRVVMQNLMSNALKFQRPGAAPRVRVRGGQDERGWYLSVTDNGIGIPPEHLSKLFVEFRRLHSRREYEGTGLGLAICQRIAELHGGRIEIASTVGQGSTFTFLVPSSG